MLEVTIKQHKNNFSNCICC